MNKADKLGIIFVIGIILQIPVTIISLKAMMVNTFLESTSRVQFDRSQIVCKEGPYKIIRHPTYLAILIWCISISMIFETKLVLIISIIIAGLIVMFIMRIKEGIYSFKVKENNFYSSRY